MAAIGEPELCQVVSSLNRFWTCPGEGHLDLVVSSFSYVKTTQDKKTEIDFRPMQFDRIFLTSAN